MDTAPIRFYLDNHISKAVVIQLRRRGVDAIHCDDVGLKDASDLEHLEYANSEGRVVVTQDRDFIILDNQWKLEAKRHCGIMMVPGSLQGQSLIRYIISALADYYEMVEGNAATLENDFADRVTWI